MVSRVHVARKGVWSLAFAFLIEIVKILNGVNDHLVWLIC